MMDNRSIQLPQVKVTAGTATKHEAFLTSEPHLIEQMEPTNGICCLVQLTPTAFEDFLLMNLPIMTFSDACRKPIA